MKRRMFRVIIMGLISTTLTACAGDRPKNVGLKDRTLSPCPSSPNCVSSQSGDQRHLIQPISYSGAADSAFTRLKQILLSRGDVSLVAENREYLMVEFRTRLGFVDDGEFLLDRERNQIQVRSAARLGYYDLGKNRGRIEEIRRAFSLTGGKP